MNEHIFEIEIEADSLAELDEGLAEVQTNVGKALQIEMYMMKKYAMRLDNADFEAIFDIIHA